MSPPQLEALQRDIAKNGQAHAIELWQGQVIDGRNRLRACQALGIDPLVHELSELPAPSAVAYVLSVNLRRRQLKTGQRAMVGARTRAWFDEDARRRTRKRADFDPKIFADQRGDARDQAGAAVGVSGPTLDAATAVVRFGIPELVEACDAGQLSVSRGARIARLRAAEQAAALLAATRTRRAKLRTPLEVAKRLAERLGRVEKDLGTFQALLSNSTIGTGGVDSCVPPLEDLILRIEGMAGRARRTLDASSIAARIPSIPEPLCR